MREGYKNHKGIHWEETCLIWYVVSTPSHRDGERMPSISAYQPTQAGKSMPPDWGLPHIRQSGGAIRGRERRQEKQIKSPSLPQPIHHCGNKRSTAILLSLANWGSTLTINNLELRGGLVNILVGATTMKRPAHNRFVKINITVPDFQVEAAIRIGANPGFVVNNCPLTAKIRQGHQNSSFTLLTRGKIKLFHMKPTSQTDIEFLAVYTK